MSRATGVVRARLRVLLDASWALHSLKAFDLFPMTEHVELVAVIEPPEATAAKSL